MTYRMGGEQGLSANPVDNQGLVWIPALELDVSWLLSIILFRLCFLSLLLLMPMSCCKPFIATLSAFFLAPPLSLRAWWQSHSSSFAEGAMSFGRSRPSEC